MAECFFFAGHQRVACTRVSTIRFTDTSQPNGRLCAGRGRLFSRDELERRMSGRSPGQAELWRGAMNRPEDSAEEKSHLTASDLAHLEEILRQATDAQAIRNAQPQKREKCDQPRSFQSRWTDHLSLAEASTCRQPEVTAAGRQQITAAASRRSFRWNQTPTAFEPRSRNNASAAPTLAAPGSSSDRIDSDGWICRGRGIRHRDLFAFST
jgi:hypothetical protein